MRRFFCILSLLIIGGYLCAQWSDWFTSFEMTTTGKRPLYSNELSLEKPGTVQWLVPRNLWNYQEGVAHLGLSLNVHTLWTIPANRQQVGLKVKIKADGRKDGSDWQNRLIHDRYYTSDEPFASDSQLWESSGRHEIEYGLAGIQMNPDEELRITLEIKQPNGSLNDGHPRLRLVGKHDYAALGPLRIVNQFLMHGGFWISLMLLTGLVYLAWSPKRVNVVK